MIDFALDLAGSRGKFRNIGSGIEPRIYALVPVFAARRRAGGVHSLANAAMLLEILFLRGNHFVEHVARLVAEGQHQVRHRVRRARLKKFLPIGPVRMRLRIVARSDAPLVVRGPFCRSVRLEPVEIVLNQFVKGGAGDIRELDLGFLACAARRATPAMFCLQLRAACVI